MIQKVLIEGLLKRVAKRWKIDKLEKLIKYVEEPNEADERIDKLEAVVFQHGRLIEILIKDSHPKKDFVVCGKCKQSIKQENK